MSNRICSDCGKPMQYCECNKIVNLVNGLIVGNGETLALKTKLSLNPDDSIDFIVTEANVLPKIKCDDCGKPMQFCECKFNYVFDASDLVLPETTNFKSEALVVTNWDSDKIILQWQSSDANVAPMTEWEYFQQIGSE